MPGTLKNIVERNTLLAALARRRRNKRLKDKYSKWKQAGSVLPMPRFGKQEAVRECAQKYKPTIFVETGTYNGDMVYAMQPHFEEIYSIELGENFFRKARKRFAGFPNVHIVHGQSGEVLPEIMKSITQPCLFWLDAHYSGGLTAKAELETPIMQELNCILAHQMAEEHILLIDDARCFTGKNDYPVLRELEEFILRARPNWIFEVKADIIKAHSGSLSKPDSMRKNRK